MIEVEGRLERKGLVVEREDLAREIASIMRANADVIAERLECGFVREYPDATANTMRVDAIHQWTMRDIENTASAIERDDLDSMVYLVGFGGDAVKDPHNPELTLFATRISDILFTTRHIASSLFEAPSDGYAHTREIIDCFEDFVQRAIARNCEVFASEMAKKGAISRRWNPMAYMEAGDQDLTPLQLRARAEKPVPTAGSIPSCESSQPLSQREEEVLALVLEGMSNGEIASSLGIRQNTVKNHVASIFGKCGVRSRVELLAKLAGR